jgi:hypothetical protein
MYVVLVGNPIDGMAVFGPFDSVEKSIEWANNTEDTWFVTVLNDPVVQG